MRHRKRALVYIGLGAVFLCSLIGSLLLPFSATLTTALALPGAAALISAVWQIFRDSEAHERAIGIKQREEFFNLSVTSHMATVAFDKHAAFCEDYVARVNKGVGELFRDGPSKNAMSIVQDLASIRQKHAPWVPADVLNGLKPFEEALWKVGINAGYVADVGDAHDRGDRIDEMYKIFSQVLGQPWQGTEQRSEVRIEQVLVYIQGVLGIEELHELRTTVVRRAIEGIRDA